jgi:methylase of polypeptide subunit release factors
MLGQPNTTTYAHFIGHTQQDKTIGYVRLGQIRLIEVSERHTHSIQTQKYTKKLHTRENSNDASIELGEALQDLFVRPPLKFYAEIIRRARQGWLKTGGHLVFECSPFNVETIKAVFIDQENQFGQRGVRFDTNGLARVISARKLADLI